MSWKFSNKLSQAPGENHFLIINAKSTFYTHICIAIHRHQHNNSLSRSFVVNVVSCARICWRNKINRSGVVCCWSTLIQGHDCCCRVTQFDLLYKISKIQNFSYRSHYTKSISSPPTKISIIIYLAIISISKPKILQSIILDVNKKILIKTDRSDRGGRFLWGPCTIRPVFFYLISIGRQRREVFHLVLWAGSCPALGITGYDVL